MLKRQLSRFPKTCFRASPSIPLCQRGETLRRILRGSSEQFKLNIISRAAVDLFSSTTSVYAETAPFPETWTKVTQQDWAAHQTWTSTGSESFCSARRVRSGDPDVCSTRRWFKIIGTFQQMRQNRRYRTFVWQCRFYILLRRHIQHTETLCTN